MTFKCNYHYFGIVIVPALLALSFVEGKALAQSKENLKLKTLVIDAGHGGHDPGCVSRDKQVREKTLTLDIASRFAAKVRASYPDVKVVMTRTTDEYVTLNERAEIANRNDANLFVSIHINTSPSSSSANGFSIHILGQSSVKNRDLFSYNMDVCKRENSVIMLEDDYATKYQGFNPTSPESFIFFNLMQNAFLEQSFLFAQDVDEAMSHGPIRVNRGIWQDPFYVLWKTSMPSALVECGFMSNSSDLAIMTTEDGRDAIAQDLLKAFAAFKLSYDSSVNIGGSKSGDTVSVRQEVVRKDATVQAKPDESGDAKVAKEEQSGPEQDEIYYGTQILASAKKMNPSDKFFKGYKPSIILVGHIYKYVIGTSSQKDDAVGQNKAIRKIFPGSFLVKVENGTTTIAK